MEVGHKDGGQEVTQEAAAVAQGRDGRESMDSRIRKNSQDRDSKQNR